MHYSLYQTYRVMHRESAGCYTGTLFLSGLWAYSFLYSYRISFTSLIVFAFLSVSHQCIIVVTNMHLFYAETMV